MMLRRWMMFSVCLLLSSAGVIAQETAPVLQPDTPQRVTVQPEQAAALTYTLQADDAPQSVTLVARAVESAGDSDAPPFDPVLLLQSADGEQLAYNDDTHAFLEDGTVTVSRDASLEAFMVSAPGTYTLLIDSFNGVSSGEVEVLLTLADPFRISVEDIATDTDSTHTRVEGFLPEGRVYQHTVVLSAGDVLTVTAQDRSGTLDLLLRVSDSSGNQLAENDDHSSYNLALNVLDARIEAVTVPDDGVYTLHLLDFTGEAGTFSLDICQNTQTCP